jgi:hypothetical protein
LQGHWKDFLKEIKENSIVFHLNFNHPVLFYKKSSLQDQKNVV